MSKKLGPILKIWGKKESLKRMLNATELLRKDEKSNAKDDRLSPELIELKNQFISFGPSGPKWAKITSLILSIALKEKIIIEMEKYDDGYKFYGFSVFKVIANTGVSCYPVGSILMALCEATAEDKKSPTMIQCVKVDGSVGNAIRLSKAYLSIASDEEIYDFTDAVFKIIGTNDPIDLSW